MNKRKLQFKEKIKTKILGFILIFLMTIVGVHFLIGSNALSPYAYINADKGTFIAPAIAQSCNGASDGLCTQFGKSPISFSIPSNQPNMIIESDGTEFIPYGFVMACAGYPYSYSQPFSIKTTDVCNGSDPSDPNGNTGSNFISAAASSWNANIVRVQTSQENLFDNKVSGVCPTPTTKSPTGPMILDTNGQAYLNLLKNLVNLANSKHMVAIITLQEELSGGLAFPSCSSLAYWDFMSNYFKNYSEVFFDLYNEPSFDSTAVDPSNTTNSNNSVWGIWQLGGYAYQEGVNDIANSSMQTYYVGMQALVDKIRANGSNNIVIAEGPVHDKDLTGLPGAALTGGNVAYGFEPNLKGDNKPSQQLTKYGQYSHIYKIMPEAFLDKYGDVSCDSDLADYNGGLEANGVTSVTGVFPYLLSLHMGLISWTLDPGVDIVGTNLSNPTSFIDPSSNLPYVIDPTECNTNVTGATQDTGNGANINNNSNLIGPGLLIQQYFKANSKQLNN